MKTFFVIIVVTGASFLAGMFTQVWLLHEHHLSVPQAKAVFTLAGLKSDAIAMARLEQALQMTNDDNSCQWKHRGQGARLASPRPVSIDRLRAITQNMHPQRQEIVISRLNAHYEKQKASCQYRI